MRCKNDSVNPAAIPCHPDPWQVQWACVEVGKDTNRSKPKQLDRNFSKVFFTGHVHCFRSVLAPGYAKLRAMPARRSNEHPPDLNKPSEHEHTPQQLFRASWDAEQGLEQPIRVLWGRGAGAGAARRTEQARTAILSAVALSGLKQPFCSCGAISSGQLASKLGRLQSVLGPARKFKNTYMYIHLDNLLE